MPVKHERRAISPPEFTTLTHNDSLLERFLRWPRVCCSRLGATAHLSGQKLLTFQGIYHIGLRGYQRPRGAEARHVTSCDTTTSSVVCCVSGQMRRSGRHIIWQESARILSQTITSWYEHYSDSHSACDARLSHDFSLSFFSLAGYSPPNEEDFYAPTHRTRTTRDHPLYRSRQAAAGQVSLSPVRGQARGGAGLEWQDGRGQQRRAAL